MTYSTLQEKIEVRKKLLILRKLTDSKSVKRSAVIADAFLYIYKLKMRLEAMQREYLLLIHHSQDVNVEKLGNGFLVRVTCKNGEKTLVSILEAFENMRLRVVHSRVTCNYLFGMEAIVEAQEEAMDVREVTQALIKAIHQKQK